VFSKIEISADCGSGSGVIGVRLGELLFEVELLFLVETFQDNVHLLDFLLDMKRVSWVTPSYLSVSNWVSKFVGCSLVSTCSHEQLVFCFVNPLSRNLNPKD